jgi:hypothetical protein
MLIAHKGRATSISFFFPVPVFHVQLQACVDLSGTQPPALLTRRTTCSCRLLFRHLVQYRIFFARYSWCRAALINENCISCVFSTFSFLSASGRALNCEKLGT